ncbi:DUF11 domain-containing protein [Actinokineospora inagensis]|uniref:DUF11 domain-containing protein n=1 Tax=Actinokineospora inagensis TaxID=103730 RepID=UPI000428115C|nr:DUF11 domain-containing protein [Actinokineospora inagensis]
MLAFAVVSAVLVAAVPAPGVGVATAPRLSISVENGRVTAAAGDQLAYTVTLRNLGANAVDNLDLTQSVPVGLRFDAADPRGTAGAKAVEWVVDLAPGGAAVFRSRMTVVGSGDRYRVATVACARTTSDSPPLVCATHSARLTAEAAGDSWVTRNRWYVAGGLILAAAVALFARRRFGREDIG